MYNQQAGYLAANPPGQSTYYQQYPYGYQAQNQGQQQYPSAYTACAPPPQQFSSSADYPPNACPYSQCYYQQPIPGQYPPHQPQVIYVMPAQQTRDTNTGNMKSAGLGALLMALCCCCCAGAGDNYNDCG